MDDEALQLSTNLNGFAEFLAKSGVDARIALLGASAGNVDICVGPPLGDGVCGCRGGGTKHKGCTSAKGAGKFGPREGLAFGCQRESEKLCGRGTATGWRGTNICVFAGCTGVADPAYMRLIVGIDSLNGNQQVCLTYKQGWADMARTDATLNIIAVTDDQSSWSAQKFIDSLRSVANPDGIAVKGPGLPEGFVFHSIVDTQPKKTGALHCASSAKPGWQYLELTKRTGGSKHKVCEPDWYVEEEKRRAEWGEMGEKDTTHNSCKEGNHPSTGGGVRPRAERAWSHSCLRARMFAHSRSLTRPFNLAMFAHSRSLAPSTLLFVLSSGRRSSPMSPKT